MPKPFTETERQQFLADKHVACVLFSIRPDRWFSADYSGDL